MVNLVSVLPEFAHRPVMWAEPVWRLMLMLTGGPARSPALSCRAARCGGCLPGEPLDSPPGTNLLLETSGLKLELIQASMLPKRLFSRTSLAPVSVIKR